MHLPPPALKNSLHHITQGPNSEDIFPNVPFLQPYWDFRESSCNPRLLFIQIFLVCVFLTHFGLIVLRWVSLVVCSCPLWTLGFWLCARFQTDILSFPFEQMFELNSSACRVRHVCSCFWHTQQATEISIIYNQSKSSSHKCLFLQCTFCHETVAFNGSHTHKSLLNGAVNKPRCLILIPLFAISFCASFCHGKRQRECLCVCVCVCQ